MNIQWIKCTGAKWCNLNSVKLQHSHFDGKEGVYIIWHAGKQPATVRVGQGVIRDRIMAHRNDDEVQSYVNLGLFVTWATLDRKYRDGVEAFLAKKLNPIAGDRFPNRQPIQVNLPW